MTLVHSYNGWPASPDPDAIGIKPFAVAGYKFPAGIKGGDVEVVFRYYAAQYHCRVEGFGWGGADEWGYAFRKNRNANNYSCHASGTALDFNSQRHPNGARRTLDPSQVAELRLIQAEVFHVVKWGGDFSGTKDEMHHEICAGVDEVHTAANELRRVGWWHRTLYLTSERKTWLRGPDVMHLQERLHVSADGRFGPETRDAVKARQRRLGRTATGAVDKALGFYIGG